MAISPLLFNGSVSRMQDVSAIKHNEDAKGMVDQTNFQNTFNREIDSKVNQVHHSDDIENRQSVSLLTVKCAERSFSSVHGSILSLTVNIGNKFHHPD